MAFFNLVVPIICTMEHCRNDSTDFRFYSSEIILSKTNDQLYPFYIIVDNEFLKKCCSDVNPSDEKLILPISNVLCDLHDRKTPHSVKITNFNGPIRVARINNNMYCWIFPTIFGNGKTHKEYTHFDISFKALEVVKISVMALPRTITFFNMGICSSGQKFYLEVKCTGDLYFLIFEFLRKKFIFKSFEIKKTEFGNEYSIPLHFSGEEFKIACLNALSSEENIRIIAFISNSFSYLTPDDIKKTIGKINDCYAKNELSRENLTFKYEKLK